MQQLAIVGSTGSIGTQALDIVRKNPDIFEVTAIAAGGSNLELLARQAVEFDIPTVASANVALCDLSKAIIEAENEAGVAHRSRSLLTGKEGVDAVAGMAPWGTVLNAVAGHMGLSVTIRALSCGAKLALANKESLVIGGSLVKKAIKRNAQITPVDSEHSAIWQCLQAGKHEKGLCSPVVSGYSEVSRLILTASGGPFRGKTRKELQNVTPEAALKHPTWNMGPLVTINSSTMFNKGLELIEACLLFDIEPEKIDVVVHPSSVVHSMVRFIDGTTMLQASPPDMALPIALGMSWPSRLPDVGSPCNWEESVNWHFEPLDEDLFPAVKLARAAIAASDTHPAVYTVADEVCVKAFMNKQLPYLKIFDVVRQVVEEHHGHTDPDIQDIEAVLEWASQRALQLCDQYADAR